jgi:hypothetical protein
MVMRDGQPMAEQTGLIPAERLVEALDSLAADNDAMTPRTTAAR